ncbi:MAG: SUMF1/EgtB/PvdO family nonheme iron enzyme [Anaerolineae bacterium]|nr:SUMF1/EgtB/PvdO family nonheme iron enzyme [Anaerolineae bacterium]
MLKKKPSRLEESAIYVCNIIGEPFEWCEVPAGPFLMGSERQKDKRARDTEPNLHKVTLPAFAIAKYPITYSQFQVFIDAEDGIGDDRWWQGLGQEFRQPFEQEWKIPNHPREHVNWYQAMAFCRWLSHRLKGEYALDNVQDWPVHLPIEAEWEKAARGTDGRIYPWGNEYQVGYANIDESRLTGGKYRKQTTPVGSFPAGASPYGVLDMAGNVVEWCLSAWTNPYKHLAANEIKNFGAKGARVVRGGTWRMDDEDARVAMRNMDFPDAAYDSLGFRVCFTMPSA